MRCRWRELLRAGSRLRVQQRVLTDIVFARLIVPRTPANCFAPNLTTSYPPRPGFLTGNAAIFGRKSAAIVAKGGVHGTKWHQALTPITIRRSASHDCRRSVQGASGFIAPYSRRLACP